MITKKRATIKQFKSMKPFLVKEYEYNEGPRLVPLYSVGQILNLLDSIYNEEKTNDEKTIK